MPPLSEREVKRHKPKNTEREATRRACVRATTVPARIARPRSARCTEDRPYVLLPPGVGKHQTLHSSIQTHEARPSLWVRQRSGTRMCIPNELFSNCPAWPLWPLRLSSNTLLLLILNSLLPSSPPAVRGIR